MTDEFHKIIILKDETREESLNQTDQQDTRGRRRGGYQETPITGTVL